MKIGRYKIAFGWSCRMQICKPTTVQSILGFIWIFKEARHTDVDKKRQFPPGIAMFHDGVRYHYYKAGEDIHVGGGTEKEANDEGN